MHIYKVTLLTVTVRFNMLFVKIRIEFLWLFFMGISAEIILIRFSVNELYEFHEF